MPFARNALLAAAAVLLSLPGAADELRFTEQRIAVVNVERAMHESADYQRRLEALHAAHEEMQTQQRRAKPERIKQLLKQAKEWQPGSPESQHIVRELYGGCGVDTGSDHHVAWKRSLQQLNVECYARVVAEISAYAKEHDYSLVINSMPKQDLHREPCGVPPYYDPPYPTSRVVFNTYPDITEAIIERLSRIQAVEEP